MNKYKNVDFNIKEVGEDKTFTAYGNTKNYKDYANDVTNDGAYGKSIDRHKEAGTSPRLLWSHDMSEMPIGVITEMKEDSHGLLFKGKLADTQKANEVYALMKMGALDSFSIGYTVQKEKYDKENRVNNLIEIDVKEISVVNFPCNDKSTLQEIKSLIRDDELPTLRQVQKIIQNECGFSKREAEKIMNQFEEKNKCRFDSAMLALERMESEQLENIISSAKSYLPNKEKDDFGKINNILKKLS